MIYLQFLLFVSHIFFAYILIIRLTWSKEKIKELRKVSERKKQSCFEKSLLAVFGLFLVFVYHQIINLKYVHT